MIRRQGWGTVLGTLVLMVACGQTTRDRRHDAAGGDGGAVVTAGWGGAEAEGATGSGGAASLGGAAVAGGVTSAGGPYGGSPSVGGANGGTSSGGVAAAGAAAGEPSSGGDGACAAGEACFPPVPKGWQGPIAAHDTSLGGDAPSCQDAFSRKGPVLYGELDGGEHSCSCSCRSPAGLACGQATFEFFTDDSCSGAAVGEMELWPNGVSSCFGVSKPSVQAYGSVRLSSIAPQKAGAGCTPLSGSVIDEALWNQTLTTCSLTASREACDAETSCVDARPSPSFNLGVCVYREGDVACPSGGYDRRMLRYRAAVDGRRCAKCTCGSLNSPCLPRVDFTVDQPTCDNGTTLETIGDCRPLAVPASAQSLSYHFVGEPAPGDTCGASEPKALGAVTESAPVTVCCEPQTWLLRPGSMPPPSSPPKQHP